MSRFTRRWHPRLGTGLVVGALVFAEYASPTRWLGRAVAYALAVVLILRFARAVAWHLRRVRWTSAVTRVYATEAVLTLVCLLPAVALGRMWFRVLTEPEARVTLDLAYAQYAALLVLTVALRGILTELAARRLLADLELRPAQTVALGFAGLVVLGALVLSLPFALTRVEDLALLDVLFTATSAVTVTGLAVYDPGTFHSGLGQAVLLALIQLGGVGTMAASASLVVVAGRRLRLTQTAAIREGLDVQTLGEVRGAVRAIAGLTLVAEGVGAGLLYLLWRGRPGIPEPAWAAAFHAVSAFCNAGFSLFPDGLLAFPRDVGTNGVIGGLVVVGGLGFPVLRALGRTLTASRGAPRVARLPLHARLALLVTGLLLAGGAVLGLVLEWRGALVPLAWPSRLLAAAFLSVTARTAGFQTLDTATLAPATLWLLMALMFVGGSPGSTAGGIKTTTAATLVAALRATVSGRSRVEAYRRTIPGEQVTKAIALVGLGLAVTVGAVIGLLATQSGEPLALAFEAVSAFGTVGLSAGATGGLDAWGKLLLMALMFVGRTGPLTLGFALAARSPRASVTYPTEKVMIG